MYVVSHQGPYFVMTDNDHETKSQPLPPTIPHTTNKSTLEVESNPSGTRHSIVLQPNIRGPTSLLAVTTSPASTEDTDQQQLHKTSSRVDRTGSNNSQYYSRMTIASQPVQEEVIASQLVSQTHPQPRRDLRKCTYPKKDSQRDKFTTNKLQLTRTAASVELHGCKGLEGALRVDIFD
jgi:hypothetical protein